MNDYVDPTSITRQQAHHPLRHWLPGLALLCTVLTLPAQPGDISVMPAQRGAMSVLSEQPDHVSAISLHPGSLSIVPVQPVGDSSLATDYMPSAAQLTTESDSNFNANGFGLPNFAPNAFAGIAIADDGTTTPEHTAATVVPGAASLPVASYAMACGPLTENEPAANFWNLQAGSPIPGLANAVRPPSAVEPLSGGRKQMGPAGQAGGWCRPPPTPFADSSPLASRSFWAPILILLFGFSAFWITRGTELAS